MQLFILGENKWRGEQEWPLARTRYTPFFLHGEGHANTVRGDGLLSVEAPSGDEAPDHFTYDPRDPVMSLMRADAQAARRSIARTITGAISSLSNAAARRGCGGDRPGRVETLGRDRWPRHGLDRQAGGGSEDGLCINLTYGITRARYRDGYENPTLLQPGKAYEYSIALNPIGILFKKGQRIRLYVSSSDFPNFDRNHNTGADYWSDTELRVARPDCFSRGRDAIPADPAGDSALGRTPLSAANFSHACFA